MQTVEFHPRGAFESGERLDAFSGSEGASPRIAIAEDHCMILRWIMRYVKRNDGLTVERRLWIFVVRSYNSGMAEHIEDLQHRFTELKKRVDVVRSFL